MTMEPKTARFFDLKTPVTCSKCGRELMRSTYLSVEGKIAPCCEMCFSSWWDSFRNLREHSVPTDWDCEDTVARIQRKLEEGV